jgi:hypothetical protein
VIADGVRQGYIEAHKAAERWWRSTAPRSRDWVGDIAAIAERPGAAALAPVAHASDDGPQVPGVSAFRAEVARQRAAAIGRQA